MVASLWGPRSNAGALAPRPARWNGLGDVCTSECCLNYSVLTEPFYVAVVLRKGGMFPTGNTHRSTPRIMGSRCRKTSGPGSWSPRGPSSFIELQEYVTSKPSDEISPGYQLLDSTGEPSR